MQDVAKNLEEDFSNTSDRESLARSLLKLERCDSAAFEFCIRKGAVALRDHYRSRVDGIGGTVCGGFFAAAFAFAMTQAATLDSASTCGSVALVLTVTASFVSACIFSFGLLLRFVFEVGSTDADDILAETSPFWYVELPMCWCVVFISSAFALWIHSMQKGWTVWVCDMIVAAVTPSFLGVVAYMWLRKDWRAKDTLQNYKNNIRALILMNKVAPVACSVPSKVSMKLVGHVINNNTFQVLAGLVNLLSATIDAGTAPAMKSCLTLAFSPSSREDIALMAETAMDLGMEDVEVTASDGQDDGDPLAPTQGQQQTITVRDHILRKGQEYFGLIDAFVQDRGRRLKLRRCIILPGLRGEMSTMSLVVQCTKSDESNLRSRLQALISDVEMDDGEL